MPAGSLRKAIADCLGMDAMASGLVGLQEYRSALVTSHRPRSASWLWAPAGRATPTTAVVFATEGGVALSGADAPALGILLHSTHRTELDWTPGTLATVVWLDTDSVVDSAVPASIDAAPLVDTPLVSGLKAFAESLTRRAEVRTKVSAYLVERLLVEMVYGVLLERKETEVPAQQAQRPMSRAKMLMLLNRADPEYGSEDLARDLHMSPRHLQRLFAREGSTPAAELRNLRAELAQTLLRDAQYDALTIAEIAGHAGFTNPSAMRRALQAVGAPAPQAIRAR